MALDLVSLVSQFLTPETVQKLSSSIGADGSQVQAAIGAAVPALLAGLAGTAAHGGAQKLADAVNQQAGALDQFSSALSGGAGNLAASGGNLLGSLLGPSGQTALAAAISKFSGLGQGVATTLLGTLMPIVLGVIGKQAGPRGFDASGLTQLFETQKASITRAMPTRLTGLLEGTGVLEAVEDTAGAARAAAGSAARATSEAASGTASGSARWLYWLVPLLIIAGFFWFMTRPQQPERFVVPATTSNATGAAGLTIGGIDVGKALGANLATLKTTLEGVTDAASAQAALPRLTEVATGIDQVTGALGQASAEQKAAVAGLVAPLLTTLTPLIDKVLAIPGVGEVLKPALDALTARLSGLAAP